MRKRTTTAILAVCTAALVVSALASAGFAASGKKAAAGDTCLVTDVGGLNDKSFNQLANAGLRRRSRTSGSRAACSPRRALPTTSRTSLLRPGWGRPDDRRRLPDGGCAQHRRGEVPEQEVRDHRLLVATCPASRRTRAASSSASRRPGTWPAGLRSRSWLRRRSRSSRCRRRPQDPAGRPVHRRLHRGREGSQPEGEGAQRLLAGASPLRTSARSSR